jgi:hypothetical protein
MIEEKKLELVDRGSFMNYLVSEICAQEGGSDVGFNTTITLYDLTRKLFSFPTVNEQEAEWIKDSAGWHCSWCLMGVLRDDSGALVRTRYCPRCGRRMRK